MAFGEKSIRKTKTKTSKVLKTQKSITREVIEIALHQYLVPMHIINYGDKIKLDIPDNVIMKIDKKADATSKS